MARGPPKLAERLGKAKFQFRDGGGESRALQTMQRQDGGGLGVERSRSLLQRRWALDRGSRKLRLRLLSAEGGAFRHGLADHVEMVMSVSELAALLCVVWQRQLITFGVRSGRMEGLMVKSGRDAIESGCSVVGLQRSVMAATGPRRIAIALAVARPGLRFCCY
ncbi:hypothetical protein RchiOBHm_Chr2g0150181 [Rosa chinensis]|uniref:Uncharacterized protein n=1 Tax=Rosa chinensis TaxID=74649 RepID=A0A2P6RZT1_ROSCH|nr:hypothetical protein RchiOBHm_Chr2g0150181 [Rosa chinensis]